MQSWEDVRNEINTKDVIEYGLRDTSCLRELYLKVVQLMYDHTRRNIIHYITLSHFAFEYRTSILKFHVYLPTMAKTKIIKAATYGERCYPLKQKFESESYHKIDKLLINH